MANQRGEPPRTITTPHGRLFHRVLGERDNAIAFFERTLPAELLKHIDWSTLDPLPQKVVEEALGKGRLDLAFTVRLAGRTALLTILWEHQTTSDHWQAWRLGKYFFLWGEWWRGQHKDARKIPVVIPVVLYHGRHHWTAPRSLAELVDVPDELGDAVSAFVPDLTYVLEDVTARSDEEIQALWRVGMARLVLQLFKHVFEEHFGHKAVELLADATVWLKLPEELQGLGPVITYILEVSEDLTGQELKKLERVLGPHAEGFVMTVAERLRQEGEKKGREEGEKKGREEGRQEGRQEGELQGRARAILEAFETLQIVVPSDIRERILGCTDIELLKKWARRALVAKSAAEIFDV